MYEQGVIRPPSEARSLLVRVTRNCLWNQCLFCPAYKGVKFSKRSVEEVKADMVEELDKFLSLTPEQKKVSSLIRRSRSMNYPLDIVLDEKVMKQVLPEIEKLERGDPDGFNRYIDTLMSYMIPQPQTDEAWD